MYRYDEAFRAHIQNIIQHDRARSSGDDILHALLRKSGEDCETLSDMDIFGNSFLLILGGHETVATSIQLTMVFLALHTKAQENVQHEIDRIVGQRSPGEWTYDGDLPQLLEGWVGAVMQEELRLISPITSVLTQTVGDQTATFDGVPTSIPDSTYVSLSQLGAHRNPKHWPCGSPTNSLDPWHPRSNQDNDLEEFLPERWFVPSSDEKTRLSGKLGFFRPQRGVYFPFSEGARVCVGRRFAQIEIAAVLAVIFRSYSVELDIGEWASDAEYDGMTPAQRQVVWQKAAKHTRDLVHDKMDLVMTMQLEQQVSIPIRLVERGHERFR